MSKNKIIPVPNMDFSFVILTQGQVAIINNADIELISSYKWRAAFNPVVRQYFAVSWIKHNKKMKTVYMHRLIMKNPIGMQIDHINHNDLDNRRTNLRICTASDNKCNSLLRKDSTSGFKGVVWYKNNKKWGARIKKDGILIHLGLFDDKETAAIAYNDAAKSIHGEFACINIV